MQTFYDVLGVPMSATQADVHRAHRTLLTRIHPDRCFHDNDSAAYNTHEELDAARLAVLEKAYAVLANPETRQHYDAYLAQRQRCSLARYASPTIATVRWRAWEDDGAVAAEEVDMLRSVMELFAVSLSAVKPTSASFTGHPQSQQQQRQQQQEQQEQPLRFTMTEVLRQQRRVVTRDGVDAPVVHTTTTLRVQRLPDGQVSVQTHQSGSTEKSDTASVLPRRVRVMEEQLQGQHVTSTDTDAAERSEPARAPVNSTTSAVLTTSGAS